MDTELRHSQAPISAPTIPMPISATSPIPCLGQLLLGVDLTGIAVPVARVAGIALIGLAVACWPGPPLVGMLTYSALVALYLVCRFAVGLTGILLWPAVVVHTILTALLAWALPGRKTVRASDG